MAQFQVVAVYPSGTRYKVREPHDSFLWALAHAARCIATADPSDTWTYEVDMTYVGSDGQLHWRGNVEGVRDLGYSPEEVAAVGVEPCRDCGKTIPTEPDRDYCGACIAASIGALDPNDPTDADTLAELAAIRARDARCDHVA